MKKMCLNLLLPEEDAVHMDAELIRKHHTRWNQTKDNGELVVHAYVNVHMIDCIRFDSTWLTWFDLIDTIDLIWFPFTSLSQMPHSILFLPFARLFNPREICSGWMVKFTGLTLIYLLNQQDEMFQLFIVELDGSSCHDVVNVIHDCQRLVVLRVRRELQSTTDQSAYIDRATQSIIWKI